MTNLVTRARKLLKRPYVAEPTPFSIRCVCGTVAQGMRQPEFQIVTCSVCSESLLVFPTNPLPIPEPPVKKKKKGGKGKGLPAAPKVPVGERLRNAALAVPRGVAARLPPREWFSRTRLAVIGSLLFLVLAVGWQIRSNRRQWLRDELGPRAFRGLQALADGELDDSRENLAVAVRALDTLGEPFAEEMKVRQAYRELMVMHDLMDGPIDEELAGATAARLSSKLHGRSLIVDSIIRPHDETGWSAETVFFMDGEPVTLDFRGFLLLEGVELEPEKRLIFGARVAGISSADANGWMIQLIPDSGVWMTEPAIYEQTGLQRDPAAAAIRAMQRAWVTPDSVTPERRTP